MAEIRAFAAYRPKTGLEDKIAALPYDVYDREEAKRVVADNPLSFLSIDRAETQFPDNISTYDDCVYEKAGQMLREWMQKGRFVQDPHPCYYLYEQTMNGRSQTGIVACASIDDYIHGVIKKHESTRVEKEMDRIRHVDACNAQTGPIFLCYRDNARIDALVDAKKQEPAVCDFLSEGNIRNRVWVISDQKTMETIHSVFEEIQSIYIADGHHRCASAVKVGLMRREQHPDYTGEEEFNYFLSVLFPQNQLMVLDYNRVVRDLRRRTSEEFLRSLDDIFEIQSCGNTPVKPSKKGEFGLYLGKGRWYSLKLREQYRNPDPVQGLDVSVLQNYVFGRILNIQNPRENSRIDFIGGIRGLNELEKRVDKEGWAAAFSLYPTSLDELFAVADAGRLMPPKSTWFEPKLLSGLFIHTI